MFVIYLRNRVFSGKRFAYVCVMHEIGIVSDCAWYKDVWSRA